MHRTSAACRAYGKQTPYCEVCGDWQFQVHHIRTRGAGGDDDPRNLMCLCPEHHTEIHRIGNDKFGAKYGLEERIQKALERARSK